MLLSQQGWGWGGGGLAKKIRATMGLYSKRQYVAAGCQRHAAINYEACCNAGGKFAFVDFSCAAVALLVEFVCLPAFCYNLNCT